jgi:hypothetical protein
MYRRVAHGIALRHDTVWQQTVQATQRRAREERPRSPEAMTPDIFERTLAAETRPQHGAALQLMYLASGRVGCVLALEKDVHLLKRVRRRSPDLKAGAPQLALLQS